MMVFCGKILVDKVTEASALNFIVNTFGKLFRRIHALSCLQNTLCGKTQGLSYMLSVH